MSIPSPRPRDAIVAQLQHLTALRAEKRNGLMTTLATLDALDRRIDAAVAELADAIRPPIPPQRRAAPDDVADVGSGGQGVRA